MIANRFLARGGALCLPPLLIVGLWRGFSLDSRPCACSHCPCELIGASALVCLENTVSLELASSWGQEFLHGYWQVRNGMGMKVLEETKAQLHRPLMFAYWVKKIRK